MTKEECLNLLHDFNAREHFMIKPIKNKYGVDGYTVICPSEKGLENFCENNSCDTCWCIALEYHIKEFGEGND